MLLEKQKTIPNKMSNQTPGTILQQKLETLSATFKDNRPLTGNKDTVIASLMGLISVLFIFPFLILLLVLCSMGTVRVSTTLIIAVLLIAFFAMILYSVYVILEYYLTPFNNFLKILESFI